MGHACMRCSVPQWSWRLPSGVQSRATEASLVRVPSQMCMQQGGYTPQHGGSRCTCQQGGGSRGAHSARAAGGAPVSAGGPQGWLRGARRIAVSSGAHLRACGVDAKCGVCEKAKGRGRVPREKEGGRGQGAGEGGGVDGAGDR
eukprot:358723-Chlamydomonas_euryale.AAC.1